LTAFVSFDEKPGIQAVDGIAPDRPPVPGRYDSVARDYEYKRQGTLTLMAGLDLMDGHIHSAIVERHRSREFVAFLQQLDTYYDAETRIRVVLDNHSANISKETRNYLATVPNRFEFTFTPKHGSWLNLVESFFGKMARTLLRGIRVGSRPELEERIQHYIDRINQDPVIYRWKYNLEDVTAA
jgi:transposase